MLVKPCYHNACGRLPLAFLDYLIQNGASINAVNNGGETVLHQISKRAHISDNVSVMQMLLKNGADVHLKDFSLKTPMHHASNGGTAEAIRLLLNRGAELDMADSAGNYPIHYIAGNYNYTSENVLELLCLFCSTPQHVRFMDIRGRTILHIAAESFDYTVILFVLEHGGNTSQVDYSSKTFLHYAAKNHLYGAKIIDCVLKAGIDINFQDFWGQTPLHKALIQSNIGAVKSLVKGGADIRKRDINGLTPLHVAATKHNPAFSEVLINAGADVNAFDKDSATPLHFAAWSDTENVVELLLDNGADKTLRDTNDETPLMTACFKRSSAAATILEKDSMIIKTFTKWADECYNYEDALKILEEANDIRPKNEELTEFLKIYSCNAFRW